MGTIYQLNYVRQLDMGGVEFESLDELFGFMEFGDLGPQDLQ